MIDMRGLLSFHLLWLLRGGEKCGYEILDELEKRRGERPSPGTVYPALGRLVKSGLVNKRREGKRVIYSITDSGRREFKKAVAYFQKIYGEVLREGEEARDMDDLGIGYI